jgi:hypothetical protein
MKKRIIGTLCLLAATAVGLSAESVSYTGTLSTPEDVFEANFTLTASGPVTIQTWGFGGGINAAGQTIAAGGFDPLIALFSGTGPTATIVTDGSGNTLADADNLYNPPWSFVGNCGPAGLVAIGTNNDCGDDLMQATLGAGTYTLVLSDSNYQPYAIFYPFDPPTLGAGFAPLDSGVFQTCDSIDGVCITTNGDYAVDIITPDESQAATPEPSPLYLLGAGLLGLAGLRTTNRRRRSPLS